MEPLLPDPFSIPLVTLAGVFLLIAVRQVGRFRFAIWQSMLLGAAVVLATGRISPRDALAAVNMDVMLFLFGMFVVGEALEESGYLAHLAYRFIKRARTADRLMILVIAGAGLLSALLMNDTLAIIGTPVVLLIARKHGMSPKLLLLALAFSITIGSAMSPIGNPQNLLIALGGGVQQPFLLFLRYLALPTLVSLGLTYLILKRFHPGEFHDAELRHSQEPIRDRQMALLSRIALHIVVVLIAVKILLAIAGADAAFPLPFIAVAAALPILVGSPRRWQILRHTDWHTLVFFAAMFVLMESVWRTGSFQAWLAGDGVDLRSPEMILGASIVLSQFISNVPLVALIQPLLLHAGVGTAGLMALAAGSTIAGNLLILGAASNVIIIQRAEKKAGVTITFLEFARAGVPVTGVSTLVYWAFLRLVP